MFIGDAWYVAAWSDEIAEKPVARRILNQPIVLYRALGGKVGALYDSCCHRGAPLSVGSVVAEGLECGYHGMVFDASGQCVKIPGQSAIPKKASVRSYPTVERHQLVWIWMGAPERANADQIVDVSYHDDRARWPHRHGVYNVQASAVMLTDNLMDLTHLGYVHAHTVGGEAGPHITAEMEVKPTGRGVAVKRWFAECTPPPTYRACVPSLPNRVERWQEFEYVAPSAVVQWTGAVEVGTGAKDPNKREGGFALRLFHGITPETETSCLFFWSAANGFRQDDPEATDALVAEIEVALKEDKWIVEVQQARVNETGEAWLVDIRSDVARVAMRRALNRLLETSGPVASGPQ
jgi:phenylpropionate dioxygenase-like ring-hydroxylating dioxygenase large terminal subunit